MCDNVRGGADDDTELSEGRLVAEQLVRDEGGSATRRGVYR